MTPQLRFPDFTDEWQVKKLGNVTQSFSTRNKGASAASVYSVTNSRGFVLQTEHFTKAVAGDDLSSYKIVRKGEFAYNPARINVGSIARFREEEGIISSLYVCFRVRDGLVGEYLEYFLTKTSSRFYFNVFGEGGVRIYLWYPLFSLIKIAVPSKPEQEKIADFLTTVDERIDLGKQKLELLQRYKRGVMQKIFSQQIRFKDDNGGDYPEWEEKKLADIAVIKTGKKDANIAREDGQYRFYTCSREYLHADVYSFEGEAILVAGNAEVGLCHYYDGKFEAYQRTYVLQNFKTDGKFLYRYLSHFFRQYALGLMQTSAMTYITLGTLENFIVPLPSENEQQKIATFLTTLDEKINTEQTKLTASRQFKKALLQRMFV